MGKAIIAKVYPGSLAEELALEPGDKILQINNEELQDLIDFQMLWAEEDIEVLIEKQSGEEILFQIEKDFDEGLGVVFEQAVFDRIKPCFNKCLFCFVDQMGPNMRSSLYEKDDDYRLSFLHGNFITLTNLSANELARIKRLHLSPLYVSVHTTDPELREKMLGNPRAKKIMEQLQDLISARIQVHTQIVLCPGINDGKYLEQTLADLSELWPGVKSIAVVPVGITKFRKNLNEFPQISQEYAINIINYLTKLQNKFRTQMGSTLVYAADEYYIKAEEDFPSSEEYDGFPQIENGIGLCRIFLDEFAEIISDLPKTLSERHYFIVTSVLGEYVLKPIIQELSKIDGLSVNLITVKNVFFGPRVTVSGLLTGKDLLSALGHLDSGSTVLFPEVMLKNGENIFLDGLTPLDIEENLNINLVKVANSAKALVKQITQ